MCVSVCESLHSHCERRKVEEEEKKKKKKKTTSEAFFYYYYYCLYLYTVNQGPRNSWPIRAFMFMGLSCESKNGINKRW